MNDEELRAFLDSATVGDDEGERSREPESAGPEEAAQRPAPAAAGEGQAPRRAVPSFDELMHLSTPDAETASVQRTAATAPISPETDASPDQRPQAGQQWSQAFAQEEEQLVPLILPGFSPEPRPRNDLPPVFQAEPAQSQQTPDSAVPHVEPAPTQPFDVLSPEPAQVTAPSPAAATAPIPATAPVASVSAGSEDPFAMLAPDLVDPDPVDDEYERISVTGSEARGRKALPWLIVGGGAVVAIIASIFVINGVRGTETPPPTDTPAVTSEPSPTEPSTTASPEPSEKPDPKPDVAPVVDPGSTYDLSISQWGLTVPRSDAFGGSTPYTLFDNDSRAMFTLPLAESLSGTCDQASKPEVWGLLKKDDGKLEVIRPEPRCTDPGDAAVYDKIWGLMDYMAKNAKAS